MTVLIWHTPDTQPRNLFTFIRHRRLDELGPWASETDETWTGVNLGHELKLFSCDSPFKCCQALVDQILDSKTLEIDGLKIHYDLSPAPRCHRAYRDKRQLFNDTVQSPFSKHSSDIIEYWSFAKEPRKFWRELLGSLPTNSQLQITPLGFPIHLHLDRIGNLMIAGAEDLITCDLIANRNQTLMLKVDGIELLPETFIATVWACHSGDEVLRREFMVTAGQTVIQLSSEVDHIGFAIYRSSDGQCIDLMEEFLIMEINIQLNLDIGPTLHFHDSLGLPFHQVNPQNSVSMINIHTDSDSAELDKGIRQLWLDNKILEREKATRQEGNLVRFKPEQFEEAVQYFIALLSKDYDQKAPVYLADPWFMDIVDKNTRLYLDILATTTERPLRILCAQLEANRNSQSWSSKYPSALTANISIRAFRKHKKDSNGNQKPGFHDRYIITPKHEIVMTHSLNGWCNDGVTFISLPYGVYRTEAERLWSMDVGSKSTDLLVREIS